jgi:hypothetical protein
MATWHLFTTDPEISEQADELDAGNLGGLTGRLIGRASYPQRYIVMRSTSRCIR